MKSHADANVKSAIGIHPSVERIMIIAFSAMFIIYVIFMSLMLNQFFHDTAYTVAPIPPTAIPTTIILPPP